MARLLVKRVSKSWVDRYRAYEIVVNGEVRAQIRRGEQVTVEVDPGQVDAHLRIDWCKSRPVKLNLALGQVALITCRPRSLFTALYGVTVGRNDYIQLDVEPD